MEAIATRVEAIATRVEAITTRVEAIATRVEAITIRVEAITTRVEAITIRVEAITIRNKEKHEERIWFMKHVISHDVARSPQWHCARAAAVAPPTRHSRCRRRLDKRL